mmetsp:Transcript_3696/g.8952  ORF Transcript_3696/g.8952 Transcript_3696/m.8952 type:complete len:217 (+) Transcript_3696:214-864(+)
MASASASSTGIKQLVHSLLEILPLVQLSILDSFSNSVRFCSIPFHFILSPPPSFRSVPFHSGPFHSIRFHSISINSPPSCACVAPRVLKSWRILPAPADNGCCIRETAGCCRFLRAPRDFGGGIDRPTTTPTPMLLPLLPPLHRDERRGGIRETYLPRTAPLESVGVGGVGSSRFDQTEIVRDDDDDCDDCDDCEPCDDNAINSPNGSVVCVLALI